MDWYETFSKNLENSTINTVSKNYTGGSVNTNSQIFNVVTEISS